MEKKKDYSKVEPQRIALVPPYSLVFSQLVTTANGLHGTASHQVCLW